MVLMVVRQGIRLTQRTATKSKFYSRFVVHNILQYYLGLGKTTLSQDRFPAIQLLARKHLQGWKATD
jgi:hypothetical protein